MFIWFYYISIFVYYFTETINVNTYSLLYSLECAATQRDNVEDRMAYVSNVKEAELEIGMYRNGDIGGFNGGDWMYLLTRFY